MRVLFIFLFVSSLSLGQNKVISEKPILNRNIISGNIGSFIIAHNAGITYDRILPNFLLKKYKKLQSVFSLSLNGNYTEYYFFGKTLERVIIPYASYGVIYTPNNQKNENKNHLEMNFGLGLAYNTGSSDGSNYDETSGLKPVLRCVYRYQAPQKGFVFKVGMGVPELFHLGFGISF